MYHYVRQIASSDFPNLKGLEIEAFRRQLDYLTGRFTVISGRDLILSLRSDSKDLPDNPCLLTFDDGYRDHIEGVVPELIDRGITGCFFPPARPIIERCLLDVHAIQFVLASASDVGVLVEETIEACRTAGVSKETIDSVRNGLTNESRFDSGEIVFLKRLLQRDLDDEVRKDIVGKLFERYVGRSVKDFSTDLYMSIEEIKSLTRLGMYVGSHTYSHEWLNEMTPAAQEVEIRRSVEFLSEIGTDTKEWIMCYPYGAYNSDTIRILRKYQCVVGLTAEVGVASWSHSDPLEMKRFDTNDFPQ